MKRIQGSGIADQSSGEKKPMELSHLHAGKRSSDFSALMKREARDLPARSAATFRPRLFLMMFADKT